MFGRVLILNHRIVFVFHFWFNRLTDPTFTFICGNTSSKTILAHVRAASAPPIVPTNNHPFIFGRHSFMHNGGVTNFAKIVCSTYHQSLPRCPLTLACFALCTMLNSIFPLQRQTVITKISKENVAMIQGNSDTEVCFNVTISASSHTGIDIQASIARRCAVLYSPR